jgi:WD40 repeat protein
VGLASKVYSGSDDKTIRVWSGDDGTHLQTLEGHTDGVRALAVGLDGKVFSGSFDSTIRVWSATDGTHLHTLEELKGGVLALAVMRDGSLVSGGGYEVENDDEYAQKVKCAELKMW